MSPADGVPCTADFLIIGAMKAGTTSLFRYLQPHPDICMSRIKEPRYFNLSSESSGDLHKGPAWYASLFEQPSKLKGEASTRYSRYPMDPDVASRIYQAIPNAKLIYLMRNPADRSCSHYLHNVLAGRESHPPQTALLEDRESTYLNTSRYALQLGRYFRHFPRGQFCLITSEHLRERPAEVVGQVLEFLGVRTFFSVAVTPGDEHNVTANRERELRRSDGDTPRPILRQLSEAIDRLRERRGSNPGAREILAELGFGAPDRARLKSMLSEDVQELESILCRPLSEWADARDHA